MEPKHAAVFFSPSDGRFYLRDLAGASGDGVSKEYLCMSLPRAANLEVLDLRAPLLLFASLFYVCNVYLQFTKA